MSKFEIGLEKEYSVYVDGKYSDTLTIQDIDNSNIVLCGECEGVVEGILHFIGTSDRLNDTKKVVGICNRKEVPEDFRNTVYEQILKDRPQTILLSEATTEDIDLIDAILDRNIQLIMSTSVNNLSDILHITNQTEIFTIVKNK